MLQQWILTQKAQKDAGDDSLWVQPGIRAAVTEQPATCCVRYCSIDFTESLHSIHCDL